MSGDLPIALIELCGMARALGLEQFPERPGVDVTRQFHERSRSRRGRFEAPSRAS
ncbi:MULTISPECIES: hypothetical protein [unclassified Phenylobacterium]|uniref:hypothetical protein n=1 Tax=unclassified Phenylobacterium TaxID=2640670 RepID=UPI00215168C7|nr:MULTISPECIES: hypothetical protein [unclassified Phenylobacterium]MCR5875886.1 hypothetical protein [Phenylobacterium sp. J426]MCR5880232.1 hypothetical protein [Phenylobacterium sp. J367]